MAFPQKPCQQAENKVKYFKGLERKKPHQQLILYPVKLSFKGEGVIQNFSEK